MKNRDYTLILDKSGSMSITDQPGGMSRWAAAEESTLALARKCEQFDPDGITVYVFSTRFQRYDNVTTETVETIFQTHKPGGITNLADVLRDALTNFLERKVRGALNKSGETILVITDGEPSDRMAVAQVIVGASQQLDRDEELAISFIQVGNDEGATLFLKALDDQLEEVGAKFDICDTLTMDEMEEMSLAEVLMNAIED
ncbi:MAG: vWA domain-containing protein [Prochlorothrix sp.]